MIKEDGEPRNQALPPLPRFLPAVGPPPKSRMTKRSRSNRLFGLRRWAWLPLSLYAAIASADEPVNFNRDIRPLLSDRCFYCHGPDASHRQADLRLDIEPAAHERAITAGKPDASALVERITSRDDDQRMPPPDSGKSLSAAEIVLLEQWIAEGGQYDSHWSFTPPKRPVVPEFTSVDEATWIANPIDAFVLARLKSQGMKHAPAADRHTLLRRVTLDLTGVPPTPAEVEAFFADESPGAYERVVDRLLASSRYGERMAQVWLDAARYADTMGYQADWERFQWRWRTWVIDAYNANLPFDRFTIDQLAGDLLPDATTEQMIATGFNRNHRINDEAGIIPEEYLVEYIVDRVDTTAATWMGLTVGCARCHDHKFDPISQADFYRMYAFFNAVPEKGQDGRKGFASPYQRVAVRGKGAEYVAVQRVVDQATESLAAASKRLGDEQFAWEQQLRDQLSNVDSEWQVVQAAELTADADVTFSQLDDHSFLVSGKQFDRPSYAIDINLGGLTQLAAVRLEALTHKSLAKGGFAPGNGNFVLTDFSVELHSSQRDKPQRLEIAHVSADYSQAGYPVANVIDDNHESGWAVDGATKRTPRTATFRLAAPIDLRSGDRLRIRMAHDSPFAKHAIGRFRLSLTDAANLVAMAPSDLDDNLRKIVQTPPSDRSGAELKQLAAHFATIAPSTADERKALAAANKSLADFEKKFTTYVMVMSDMAKPRPTYVLERGVYNKPGERVEAGVPSDVLGGLPDGAPANRLGLAQWLVSGKHPLTGRVAVNRYWNMLFGRGLVETIEDFGLQGSFPSHPALLDWLAIEYPRTGWDTKAMLKLMVMSNTYRQSSFVSPDASETDPHNRWLARMSRVRLPAEMIRDQALFASGLLVEKIGGPSVKPYQPVGLWEELSFQDKNRTTDFYVQGTGDDLYRRGIYTFWKRSVPPPTLETFDAPTRDACTLNRSRTNTPLQALALMNDVTFVEASRRLAERALASGGDLRAQLDLVYRSLLSRSPNERELELLSAGYRRRLAYYDDRREDAGRLIAAGESPVAKSVDAAQLAALTTCVMNIMNLDETITRE